MTTITTDELVRLAQRYDFSGGTARMLTDVLEEEDWSRPPSENGGNTAHWLLGHIVTARRSVLRKLGDDRAAPEWEDQFDIGRTPGDPSTYVSVKELLGELADTSSALKTRISELTPEEAAKPWGSSFPDGGESVLDGLAFFNFHETYHVGQLGLLRRIAGKPGFA